MEGGGRESAPIMTTNQFEPLAPYLCFQGNIQPPYARRKLQEPAAPAPRVLQDTARDACGVTKPIRRRCRLHVTAPSGNDFTILYTIEHRWKVKALLIPHASRLHPPVYTHPTISREGGEGENWDSIFFFVIFQQINGMDKTSTRSGNTSRHSRLLHIMYVTSSYSWEPYRTKQAQFLRERHSKACCRSMLLGRRAELPFSTLP
jgi:hypothetical protein